MKVPRQVKEFATQHGFNSVLFAGTLDGASVYSVGVIGNDGTPVPTGMPTYILLKGGEPTIVSGKEGFDLLFRL